MVKEVLEWTVGELEKAKKELDEAWAEVRSARKLAGEWRDAAYALRRTTGELTGGRVFPWEEIDKPLTEGEE